MSTKRDAAGDTRPARKPRGTLSNPPNRFERLAIEPTEGHAPDGVETVLLRDSSRSVISRNYSPDVRFDASLNPYRGCATGCPYCYARPGHEYLGFSAGLPLNTSSTTA